MRRWLLAGVALVAGLGFWGGLFWLGSLPEEREAESEPAKEAVQEAELAAEADHWAVALEAGFAAATAAQTAATPEEWGEVEQSWTKAIVQLKLLEDGHPNYAEAAEKQAQYEANREAARQQKKKAETAWLPDGDYTLKEARAGLTGTTMVGWRWLQRNEYDCSYGDACWGMEVVPKDGCANSLYVELTLLDGSGANVGLDNDSSNAVNPGQRAILVFESFEDRAASARVAEISCY